MLVYFPREELGNLLKNCYWYGPYKIVQQHTDVTFKIRKDKETKTLIVHVDRLRPYGTQVFRDENEASKEQDQAVDVDNSKDSSDPQIVVLGNSQLNEIELDYSGRRQRKRPAWHSEYEFDYKLKYVCIYFQIV